MVVNRRPAVLYHYPCPDGAFAALAAHLYFSAVSAEPIFFPNTVYSPITPQPLPLPNIDHLYLLDFVGPLVSSRRSPPWSQTSWSWTTTRLPLEPPLAETWPASYIEDGDIWKMVISDNKAAVARFDGVRRLFKYIEDGDLWRWKLPNSKVFSSGFKDLNLQYDLLSLDLESLISEGMASLSEKQKLIDEALSQSYEIALGGGAFGNCLAVNADSISELRSELGHQLATQSRSLNLRGIGAVVYRVPELENDQMLKISLRSVETEDTTLISQEFGGSGHRNASSFMLGSAEFKQWKL